MTDPQTIHNYYVDEAGDPTLFDKQGKIIVGTPGVSNYFLVGVAHVPNPQQAHRDLEDLRRRLLGDPYFKGVPSMRSDADKTALCFHAKNDLPEVRREVFKLLPQLLAKDYRLIMDLDDTRNLRYGEWYSDSNPLTLDKIKSP